MPSKKKMVFDKRLKTMVPAMVPVRIPTSEATNFKQYVILKLREARVPQFSGTKKVIFEAWGVYPNRIHRDLTNFSKPIVDAFKEGGHVIDDNIVLWREQDWRIQKGVYGIEVKIYESDLVV